MPIPDYQTLMLPVLRIAAEGETRVPDVEGRLADLFGLTQDERDQLLPSGRQKVLHISPLLCGNPSGDTLATA